MNQLIYNREDFIAFTQDVFLYREGSNFIVGDAIDEGRVIECLDSGGRILLTSGPVNEMDIISYFKLTTDGYQEFEYKE